MVVAAAPLIVVLMPLEDVVAAPLVPCSSSTREGVQYVMKVISIIELLGMKIIFTFFCINKQIATEQEKSN